MKYDTYQNLIDAFDSLTDECNPVVEIWGMKYLPSRMWKESDPLAYELEFEAYLNSLFLEGLITQEQLENGGQ